MHAAEVTAIAAAGTIKATAASGQEEAAESVQGDNRG